MSSTFWTTETSLYLWDEWIITSFAFVVAILIPIFFHRHHQRRQKQKLISSTCSNIPWAPGSIPILGHAIAYRKDPSKFLVETCQYIQQQQRQQQSSTANTDTPLPPIVFQINLAGKHMILVSSLKEQKQLANLPESILSANQAVADIGFEYTLGNKNVYQGTHLHKRIIKNIFHKKFNNNVLNQQVQNWISTIQDAFEIVVGSTIKSSSSSSYYYYDFFHLIRRVILRSTIDIMVGRSFLQENWHDDFDFITVFMDFQDTIEDVTAKAVVLPKCIALPLLLYPLQRRRLQLQLKIEQRLQEILNNTNIKAKDDSIGFWLQDMLNDKHSLSDISEYIIGLLFAAHKNPAIGIAQSYLFLQEYGTSEIQQQCQQEAKTLLSNPTPWTQIIDNKSMLRRLCLESLRLTAHSIGAVRTAKQDITITTEDSTTISYIIPKGSTVGFTHIATSLNVDIWGNDASKFNPKQYSDDMYTDEYKYTVFSHGIHKCPGQSLALMLLQTTLAILLVDYDIKLPKTIPSLSFERATLAQREKPVMVTIKPKQN